MKIIIKLLIFINFIVIISVILGFSLIKKLKYNSSTNDPTLELENLKNEINELKKFKNKIEQQNERRTELRSIEKQKNSYSFPHDWNVLISPDYSLCGNENQNKMFTFVSFVILGPHHFEQRQKIRETWANKQISDKFKVFFMLGLSHDENVNNKVKEESKIHKDIVQEDYYDSFHSMTMKIMGAFKWISKYCSNSHFVLRINDDMVVNTYKLLNYLDGLVKNNEHKNKLIGSLYYGQGPHRDPNSKFHVPYEVFPENSYPPFPSGIAYIFSLELAKKFFEYSLNFYIRIIGDFLEGFILYFNFFISTRNRKNGVKNVKKRYQTHFFVLKTPQRVFYKKKNIF
jgi:hypothetical protein